MSLGAQRHEEDHSRLVAASKEGHGCAQRGALHGLGASTHERALPELLSALRPGGRRSFVRIAAAEALGRLLPRLPEHARRRGTDALVDALRDPISKVRAAAASALAAAGAKSAAAALSGYARTLVPQNAVGVERSVSGLRRQGGAGAMTGRVENLEKTVRTLRDQLEKLQASGAKPPPSRD